MENRSKKILVLQTRQENLANYELGLVIGQSGLHTDAFTSYNFLVEKNRPEINIRDYTHVIMTGSGVNISEGEKEWFGTAKKFIKECSLYSVPFYGICFGMQFLAYTFGADLIKHDDRKEVGAKTIHMKNHKGTFFEFLPEEFQANNIHSDFVENLPDVFINVAYSNDCKVHAIIHKTKKMYGTQFHPEHSKDSIQHYLEVMGQTKYFSAEQNQKVIDSMVNHITKVKQIIPKFLEL